MNPVRLEIIQDDPTAAPRLSRIMPAVINRYVPEWSFIEFCDNIDTLLIAAATDYRCRANRSSWWNNGVTIWVGWFLGLILSGSSDDAFPDTFLVVSIVVCILSLVTIRIWMNCSTGVKPAAETLSDIRLECEAMSKRTTCASFHLATSPLRMIHFQQYLNKIPIEYIAVSVSDTGFELIRDMSERMKENDTVTNTGSGVPHSADHTKSAVTSDYRQLDMV